MLLKNLYLTILIAAVGGVCARAGANDLQFDVLAVRKIDKAEPGVRRGCKGGPGTATPEVLTCARISLSDLVFKAYDLETYEYTPPQWMDQTWLAITARVPPGTTKEQLRRMYQSLLSERFRLQYHREPKAMTIYKLVTAKDGSKLRESPAGAPAAETEFSRVPGSKIGEDHFPVFPDGSSGLMGVNNYLRWKSSNVATADIARVMKTLMRSDVLDETGLKGKYDVDMFWQVESLDLAPNPMPFNGPDIKKTLNDRLGLKLEPQKGNVSLFVVDQVEKTPTEN